MKLWRFFNQQNYNKLKKKKILKVVIYLYIVSQIFFLNACNSNDKKITTMVIANWDVVPYQLIDKPCKIGVIAFHESGVDVEFKVNRVLKEVVRKPTHNNDPSLLRTDKPGFGPIYEYWTEINPSLYPDGPITLSATAYSGSQESTNNTYRTLPDIILYANSGKTLTNSLEKWVATNGDDSHDGTKNYPYKTIEKAFKSVGPGGTVRVKAGTYTCWNSSNRGETYKESNKWTTITRDPDASRNDVIIKPDRNGEASCSFDQTFVRWYDVTLKYEYDTRVPQVRNNNYMIYTLSHFYTWFDSVDMISEIIDSPSKYQGYIINDQGSKHYMTNCNIYNFLNVFGWFQRNCFIQNVGSDVWRARDNLLAVNVHVDNMDPNEEAHPDLIQVYKPGSIVDNNIYYNIKATNMNSQGIHSEIEDGQGINMAFVNMVVEKTINDIEDRYSQTNLGDLPHLLFWHCTFHNLNVHITDTTKAFFWNIQNNIFNSMYTHGNPANTDLAYSTASHNLYRFLIWNQSNGPIGNDNLYNEFISKYVPNEEDYPMCQPIYNPVYVKEAPFDIGYHDPDTYDYHLHPDSPARSAGVPLECVPADIEGKLYDGLNPSIGAYQY